MRTVVRGAEMRRLRRSRTLGLRRLDLRLETPRTGLAEARSVVLNARGQGWLAALMEKWQ